MHRVVDNYESLCKVADEFGVSHETIRRIMLHGQQAVWTTRRVTVQWLSFDRGTVHCWPHRYTTSVAQANGTTTSRSWTGVGKGGKHARTWVCADSRPGLQAIDHFTALL
jgi:hypothetical protein